MKRKAFTLVEMMVVISIFAMVIASMVAIQSIVMRGLADATGKGSAQVQAAWMLDRIQDLASVSSNATITNSGGTLKLVAGENAVDTNNDGFPDSITPSRISKRGLEEWGSKKRYWVSWVTAGGALTDPDTGVKVIFAATDNDTAPTSGQFITLPQIAGALSYIKTLRFTSGTSSKDFKVQVTSSVYGKAQDDRKTNSSTSSNDTLSLNLTRSYFLERWRT